LSDCAFGYRDSFFKHSEPGRYVILSVTLKLRKQPIFHISYGAIKEELEKAGVKAYSIKAIADAVIRIRSSKLPDPAVTGNAGSFFKNPSIPVAQFEILKKDYPEISGYPASDGMVKVAAGWLIEHSGPAADISWKGYRVGDAGVHPRQALVLVNYGKANGKAIVALASAIQSTVFHKYNIKLEKEVNFY
jgi:UDP-N-acetylmuramate dehydrogenase